jgi:hypothetical protein
MDFRRRLPEIRWQSCLSRGLQSVPSVGIAAMAAMAAGSFSQAFEQMTASGHFVGVGRVGGHGAQHAVQYFAALLLKTGVRRAGSRSACVGNADGAP